MILTALKYSHELLKEIVNPGDTVIDATTGNGHDTVFLAKLVGETGHVFGFDIQKVAIENTRNRLEAEQLDTSVTLIEKGHETIHQLIPLEQEIQAAIFNLGYLPSGDKNIITHASTTILAIEGILERLNTGGRIILVVYYGHTGGVPEKSALTTFVQELPQELYTVLSYQFINQKNQPPLLLVIEKK